jgi:hypothetical protein
VAVLQGCFVVCVVAACCLRWMLALGGVKLPVRCCLGVVSGLEWDFVFADLYQEHNVLDSCPLKLT